MQRTTLPRRSRAVIERLWQPFTRNVVGEDINKYELREALRDVATASDFTCQVNGAVGGAELLEDFFVVVLTAFDVRGVHFATGGAAGAPTWAAAAACGADSTEVAGVAALTHARPLLGWRPTDKVIALPFTMRAEGCRHGARASHITLRAPLPETLRSAECPDDVADCLGNPDALRALVTLRRARVPPSFLTARALLSATKRPDTWRSALGIL